jgi:hypothetical protein
LWLILPVLSGVGRNGFLIGAFAHSTALGAGEKQRSVSEVVMPNPGNFNPEWGYLAPKPGFIRSARTALAAGAIGTVAGMAVAVALIAHPSADISVAARTMAQSGVVDASPTSPVSAASAELLESDVEHVTAPPVAARTSGDPRDVKNFAAAESHSAATTQQPAGVSALAEAPAVNGNATDMPSGPTPLSSPKKLSKVPQRANVAALAAAPALRDDASEMSIEAAPAPSPKKVNNKVHAARVRTPRSDPNIRDGEKGGPLDFLPLIGRTILGANWNDQVR